MYRFVVWTAIVVAILVHQSGAASDPPPESKRTPAATAAQDRDQPTSGLVGKVEALGRELQSTRNAVTELKQELERSNKEIVQNKTDLSALRKGIA